MNVKGSTDHNHQPLPPMQRAVIVSQTGQDAHVSVEDVEIPQPGPAEILIHLTHTGVCHADVAFVYGEWEPLGFGMSGNQIPGHEGVGYVTALGADVNNFAIGDKVGTKWQRSICQECYYCRKAKFNECSKQVTYGRNAAGSFAHYVTSPANYTPRVPQGIANEVVGPLLCGGVTMYRALRRCNLRPGDWVAIIGAGGGLGHMGIQFAKRMGLLVLAIDSGEKEDLSLSLGADLFLDFRKAKDVPAEVRRHTEVGASAVLVCAGTRTSYEQGVAMLSAGGTLVCIALPRDEFYLPIHPSQYLTKGLTVTGINASSVIDVEETLKFAAENNVVPSVSVYPLSEARDALAAMREQKTVGRIVLNLT